MVLLPQSRVAADISFYTSAPAVHTIAVDIKGAGMLNGVTMRNENVVLVSDTMKGFVHRVDLHTEEHVVLMGNGPEKKRIPVLELELNGIRRPGNSVRMFNAI
jgi:hypothetical protein